MDVFEDEALQWPLTVSREVEGTIALAAAAIRARTSSATRRSCFGPLGIGAPPTIVARTAESVPRSACHPRRPRSGAGTAAAIATTFPSRSPDPITQSMPFFRRQADTVFR